MKVKKSLRPLMLSLLIVAMLVFTMACSSSPTGNSETSTAPASSTTASATTQQAAVPGQLPLVEPGKVTFEVMSYQNWDTNAFYDASGGLPVENEIEKLTGIKIKWTCVNQKDYDTAAQTRLASGTDLPDIIKIPGAIAGLVKYSSNGIIVDMSQYMNDQKTPNLIKLFSEKPIYKAECTSPDGKIYGLPDTAYDTNNIVIYWNCIRQDWLDKLGLSMPQTIDELYNVLVAFRDKDPNGNGKKDEIPFGYLNSWQDLSTLQVAFGIPTNRDTYLGSDGKVHWSRVEENYLAFLTEMNKWYKEGLLPSDAGGYERNPLISQDRLGGLQANSDNVVTFNGICSAVNANCNYQYLPMLTNKNFPDNQPKLSKRGSWGGAYTGITKDCKDPQLATQWIDWVYASQDSKILRYYGFEGQTFDIVNGEKVYRPTITETENGAITELRKLGAAPNFLINEYGEYFLGMYKGKYPEKAYNDFKDNMVPPVEVVIGTQEEMDDFVRISGDLNTFVSESCVGFITGTKPLTEWKSYIEKCKAMGVDRVIELKQAWYDRANQIK